MTGVTSEYNHHLMWSVVGSLKKNKPQFSSYLSSRTPHDYITCITHTWPYQITISVMFRHIQTAGDNTTVDDITVSLSYVISETNYKYAGVQEIGVQQTLVNEVKRINQYIKCYDISIHKTAYRCITKTFKTIVLIHKLNCACTI